MIAPKHICATTKLCIKCRYVTVISKTINYLFFWIMSSFFSLAQKTTTKSRKQPPPQKTKATRQRKLELYNYNIQLQLEIYSYIKFYCFLTRYYNWQLTKPKILPTFLKNMTDNMFCTKNKLLTPKTVLKVSLFRIFY